MNIRSSFCIKPEDRRVFGWLILVPAITFGWSFLLRAIHGPYYSAFYADPEYMYLLNALNILNFVPPDHIDNPGTTLQVLSALTILVKWIVHSLSGSSESLQISVMKNPEGYLEAINISINLLLSAAILFAGIVTYRCRQLLMPALVIQLSPLLYLQTHIAVSRVSPEPLLFFSVVLLGSVLIPGLVGTDSNNCGITDKNRPVLAGIIFGFGLATKITFAPLLGVVFLFKGVNKKLAFISISCLSFITFTLPVITHYPKMFRWFYSVASHQGAYGSGRTGLPDATTLFQNLAKLFVDEPFIFILALCYFVILLLLASNRNSVFNLIRVRNLLASGLLIIFLQVLLAAKHPGGLFSGTRYMIPSMALTAIINTALIYCLVCTRPAELKLIKYIVAISMLLGTILVIFNLKTWVDKANKYRIDVERVKLLASDKGIISIPYYGAPRLEYALSLGNDFSGYRYENELKRIYPSLIFYEFFKKEFYSYEGFVSRLYIRSYLTRGHTVLLYGIPMGKREGNMQLEPFFASNRIGAYKIAGFTD